MPSPDEKTGILPLEIKKLVDSRRQVKQMMADKSLSADLRMQVKYIKFLFFISPFKGILKYFIFKVRH